MKITDENATGRAPLEALKRHLVIQVGFNPDDESGAMLETHQHVIRAVDGLLTYVDVCKSNDPIAETIVSLLADLRHLCKGLDVDFTELMERSAAVFEEEDVDE